MDGSDLRCDLRQFLHASFYWRLSLGIDCLTRSHIFSNKSTLYAKHENILDARNLIICVDWFLYMGCGKYIDLPGSLELP
ncbi:hypothetical protein D3C75_1089390 [compost metagenome]